MDSLRNLLLKWHLRVWHATIKIGGIERVLTFGHDCIEVVEVVFGGYFLGASFAFCFIEFVYVGYHQFY